MGDYVAYTIPNCGYVPERACSLCPTCGKIIYEDFQKPCGTCKLKKEIELLSAVKQWACSIIGNAPALHAGE